MQDQLCAPQVWPGRGWWRRSDSDRGTSLVVQWVRLHAPNAGGPGLIPGRGTRFRIRLHAATESSHAATKVRTPQLKILHAATKTWRNQNK